MDNNHIVPPVFRKRYDGTGSMVAPTPREDRIEVTLRADRKRNARKVALALGFVVTAMTAFAFIGLFVWMYLQYDEVKTDVEGQIKQAVATAVKANSDELEEVFQEREKEPNRTFSGPEDYGRFSFQYPKTWSVYVQSDAVDGGTYEAFFSPKQVEPVKDTTPNSLRLTIIAQPYESVVRTYESYVTAGTMTMKVINVNGNNTANLYTGQLPSQLSGMVCLIKIRDKTVILQTDSELYKADFLKILTTVAYNS